MPPSPKTPTRSRLIFALLASSTGRIRSRNDQQHESYLCRQPPASRVRLQKVSGTFYELKFGGRHAEHACYIKRRSGPSVNPPLLLGYTASMSDVTRILIVTAVWGLSARPAIAQSNFT